MFSALLLLWTAVVNVYHAGVFPPPHVNLADNADAKWFDRHEFGLNHLVLAGPAFARGRRAGELTRPLLIQQEQQLISQLRTWIPSR